MTPAVIALILSLIEEATKDAPALVADIQAIFAKENPTPADWEALRAKVLGKSYEDYVPQTALPATVASQPGASQPATETATTAANVKTDVAGSETPGASQVICPKCNKVLVPNSPDNCNC